VVHPCTLLDFASDRLWLVEGGDRRWQLPLALLLLAEVQEWFAPWLTIRRRLSASWILFSLFLFSVSIVSHKIHVPDVAVALGLLGASAFIETRQHQRRRSPGRLITGAQAPKYAEFLLYLALPRRNRESYLGCHNEDFATNPLPKFGPLLARFWYWVKALQYVLMYACAYVVQPLVVQVIEPMWRVVLLPLLKWAVAPAFLLHKVASLDRVRAWLEKLL
jgi:hypothetical protein